MKKAIVVKWVKALRSGNYKQGTGQLRDDSGNFCCLGVLCNIHAQEYPRIAEDQTDPTVYLGESACLPYQVRDWADLRTGLGEVWSEPGMEIDGEYYDSLADANDRGVSFDDIADWIEKNYKEL